MWTKRSFRVSKKSVFSYFWLGVFTRNGDGNKENEWWKCSGVYGFDFLCCFLLFGMNEWKWILLDIGLMWGKGAAKQWGIDGILDVELKKEEQ
jgi:hypothetical protein